MARLTLDLPQELIAELGKVARRRGKNTSDFIREALELYFRQRTGSDRWATSPERPEIKPVMRVAG